MMNIKKTTVGVAVSALIGLGVSGQATASVYGTSALNIENLVLSINDASGAVASGVAITDFDFTTTNTATLNLDLTGTVNACGGTPLPGTCGSGGSLTLDGPVANANGNTFDRVNNQTSGADSTLTVFGIGGGDWANSDSVIYTSQLTHPGSPSDTDQIAQSNLDGPGTQASSNTEIKSITDFTFTFTIPPGGVTDGPYSITVSFAADPDMRAQILNEPGGNLSAEASMSANINVSQDSGGTGNGSWAPDGDGTNLNCSLGGGVTCINETDTQDLNKGVSTGTNNTTDDYSWGPNLSGTTGFGITFGNLTAGDWTLNLTATTTTFVKREVQQVPEPGMLVLLGIGLAGMGFIRRRQKYQA